MQRHDKELMATDGYGNTLLIWAADRGALNCLNYLLEKKAVVGHINHRGYLGNTALSRAARGGHVRCVEALLSRPEIDPNIPNDKKQYPLHFAAFKNKLECVRAFIKSNKCDYNVRDRKGRVPAEDCSNPDIISMLIEAATSPTGLPKRYDGGYDGRFGRVGAQGVATKQPPTSPLRSPSSKSGPPGGFFSSNDDDDSDVLGVWEALNSSPRAMPRLT